MVASNHPDHAEACAFFGVPFAHLPVEPAASRPRRPRSRSCCERRRTSTWSCSPATCRCSAPSSSPRYPHGIINIHHSLLPAFVGAKPYHRAYERGVKIIGATAHYATADLDEGPILVQDVARVTHRDGVEDLVARGRDLEALVLARAVKLHLAAKVLVHGRRAVVFG